MAPRARTLVAALLLLLPLFARAQSLAQDGEKLLATGKELLAAGALQESETALTGALAAFRAAGKRQGEARVLKELGNLRLTQGAAGQAADIAWQALPLARETGDRDLEARLHNNLGLALKDLGRGSEAYEEFRESRRIAVGDRNEMVEAIALGNLGDLDLASSDIELASQRLQRAAVLVPKLNNPALAARVFYSLAQARSELQDWEGALTFYRRALLYGQETGLSLGVAGLWLGIGSSLQHLDRPTEAVDAFRESLELGRRVPDDDTQAAALQGMAVAYNALKDSANEATVAELLQQMGERLKRDDWLEAAKLHREAARFREENQRAREEAQKKIETALAEGDHSSAALLLLDLGTSLIGEEELEQAADVYIRSLELSRQEGQRLVQDTALRFLNKLFTLLHSHPRETEYLLKMAEAAHELGYLQLEGIHRLQLGMAWLIQRDPDRALKPLGQALALLVNQGFPEEEREALENLAFAHRLRGDRDEVLRIGERLLQAAGGDPRWEGAALHQIGMAHLEKDDLEPAARALEASLAAYEKFSEGDQHRLSLLFSLGNLKLTRGAEDEAAEHFQRMRQLAEKQRDFDSAALAWGALAGRELLRGSFEAAKANLDKARTLGTASKKSHVRSSIAMQDGLLASALGDDRKAIREWERILAIARETKPLPGDPDPRSTEVLAQGIMARAYANLGELREARELAESAVALAGSMESPQDRSLALDHLAYVQFREGRLEEAESSLRQAIELFEQKRTHLVDDLLRAAVLDQVSTAYELLQQVLVRLGKPEEALAIAERARARALLEVLRGTTELPAPDPARLRQAAAAAGATVIEYSLLHDPAKALVPARIRGEQADLEQDLFIWVIPPSGRVTFHAVDLGTASRARLAGGTLTRRVLGLRDTLASRPVDDALDQQDARRRLRELHDLLIGPIAHLLPDGPDSPVVLVPQGPLFFVPFPALLDTSGRHLIERHTLLVAPSLETLAAFRRPERRSPGAAMGESLIVGNPSISPRLTIQLKLEALPGASEEADRIAAILGSEPLLDQRATRAAVLERMPQARLIHLATHGLLSAGSRDQPGALVLAPASADDEGLLDAETVRKLRLKADLVVLSACDSGRGRLSGDGVIGLARSFLTAGAAAAITTLWRIDDRATAILMTEFYRHLNTGDDPARSLRAAMHSAIARGEGPRHWAAFLFIGAPPEPLETSPASAGSPAAD